MFWKSFSQRRLRGRLMNTVSSDQPTQKKNHSYITLTPFSKYKVSCEKRMILFRVPFLELKFTFRPDDLDNICEMFFLNVFKVSCLFRSNKDILNIQPELTMAKINNQLCHFFMVRELF